jgi:protein involved in polysaccharide export with SLBB domain
VLTALGLFRTRTRRAWLSPVVLALLPAGCSDSRITLTELQRLEAEAATVEPVGVSGSELALSELRPYALGVGDVLSVTLTGLSAPYVDTIVRARVHDDGFVTLPVVGRVKVGGLSYQAAERGVYDAFVPAYSKDLAVYIQLDQSETTTVVVVGAGGTTGPVTLRSNERNVLYAVAGAGGFGPAGSGIVSVRPIRPDQEPTRFDLRDVNDLRRALIAPPLRSGDMIILEPADTNAVFVTGLVNLPGPVSVAPNGQISLMRTIASTGGTREFLDPKEATLWRRLPSGEQVRVKLDLGKVRAGEEPDIALLPGDILDIPHTPETLLTDWFVQNVRLGTFSVGVRYDPLQQYNTNRAISRSAGENGFLGAFTDTLRLGIPNLVLPPVPAP